MSSATKTEQPTSLIAVAVLGLAALVLPTVAHGQTGFEVGARLGYGLAMGKVSDDGDDLNDGISGQIPLWIDIGYRPLDALMLGLYFQYGFGLIGDGLNGCDRDAVSCSASDVRLGVQVHYHLQPREQIDPWVGLGVGYEWMAMSTEGLGAELGVGAHGFEFLNLQLGLDIKVAEQFVVGPFLSFSLGQYDTLSAKCTGTTCGLLNAGESDIDDRALHQWLLIGVRGAYTP